MLVKPMTRNDFSVGQTVYLKSVSHLYRHWENERIIEARVTKIGRKYITVESDFREYQFAIDDEFEQKTEYNIEYELFLTEQAIRDYWQSAYLRWEISSALAQRGRDLSLGALKDVALALGIPLDCEKGA